MLLATTAFADSLRILGPSGLVAPDGFPIAVVREDAQGRAVPMRSPQISADGAELRPGAPEPPLSTFFAAPKDSAARARTVVIRASDGPLRTEARFQVGPPAAKVELVLEPAAPVKGRDADAKLSVRLLRPDGSPDPESSPPVLRANVGTITGLHAEGPGLFQARYVLPSTRYPEVAVIAAFAPWPAPSSIHGAVGRLLVPLSTSVTLPGRTEPNAHMSIEIAGQKYGPVDAGPDGRFDIPVVVPPGHRFGTGSAVDRVGNKRITKVDLMLPPTDQLACVMNPTRLPADGAARARILCASSDPYGAPARNAKIAMTVRRGQLTPARAIDEGLQEWIYTAPRTGTAGGTAGVDTVSASWSAAGPQSREEIAVELIQGPAHGLTVRPAESLVHRGSQLPVAIAVTDGAGRPRAGAHVHLRASVGEAEVKPQPQPGSYLALYRPPEQTGALDAQLEVRALGPLGTDPARLSAWTESGELFVSAVDLAGLPVADQPLVVGGKTLRTDADGVLALGAPPVGSLELSHAQWPGLRLMLFGLAGGRVWPRSGMPGAGPIKLKVALAPPTPVNIRMEIHGHQVRYWVEDTGGRVLPERQVEVALSSGTRGPEHVEGMARVFEVRTGEPATVSIADRLTGVTALAEVRP